MENEKIKIILADDNSDVREIMNYALTAAGYYVDTVEDGFSLLSYLKENQDMDAIILDLIMPDGGGLSIFESIRSVAPATRIIIFSEYTAYKNSVFGKAADAFVEKLEGVSKILEVLKELL